MRERSFEWRFRLAHKLQRLRRRYLIFGSQFVWLVLAELLGLRQFPEASALPGLAELSKRESCQLPSKFSRNGGFVFSP
jgi:hypothetical protein